MKSGKYIVVTGGDGGFGNLGDEWLLDAVKDRYKKIKKQYRVIILMANIPSFSYDGFKYIKDNPEAFSKAAIPVQKIKAVHFYGGGYVNKFWMHEKLWLYDFLISNNFPAKHIFFTCQGLGPFEKEQLLKVKNISKDAGFFGSRDLCFSDEVNTTFMFDETVHFITSVKKTKLPTKILLNVRLAEHVGANENELKKIIVTVNKLAQEKNLKLEIFPMVEGSTFSEINSMKNIISDLGIEAKILKRSKNFKLLLKRYEEASLVVTTSYHATLAALYKGVPVVALYENDYYKYKFNGLNEALKTPYLNLLNLQEKKDFDWVRALSSADDRIDNKIAGIHKTNEIIYQKVLEGILK